MCDCSFYHIVTETVLNEICFGFIIIRKFDKSRDLF